MQIYIPVAMTTSRALFILACLALSSISGCSIHRPYLSGEVSSRIKNDTLIIKYDIHIKNPAIDSVAFQLLPAADSWLQNDSGVYYASEERVKDSVYRSLGDSLPCCYSPPPGLLLDVRYGRYNSKTVGLDTSSLCWWHKLSYRKPDTIPESKYPNPFSPNYRPRIDSILAAGPVDSLRKISVPCDWKTPISGNPQYHIDAVLQTDSVIYIRDSGFVERSAGRTQQNNGAAISMQGQLRYPVAGYRDPVQYALKFYANDDDAGAADRSVYFWGYDQYALDRIWGGVIPPRPKTEIYQSAESGNMLGMMGGIGAVKNDLLALSSRPADTVLKYGFSLAWGIMYYTPHFIHAVGFDLLNSDSYNLFPILFTTRYHYRSGVSRGPLFTASIGFSGLEKYSGGKKIIGENDLDLRVGAGYETSFDRIEYAYHTAHGGYHRFDLLVGIAALAQGKAGLKWSLLTGDRIRTATLGVYMENRIDPTALKPYNSRPLLVQAALYAGMVAGWVALL